MGYKDEFYSANILYVDLKLKNSYSIKETPLSYFCKPIGDNILIQIGIDIFNDPNIIAKQGSDWNVLIPENINYVLKTLKNEEYSNDPIKIKKAISRYISIQNTISQKFLLPPTI